MSNFRDWSAFNWLQKGLYFVGAIRLIDMKPSTLLHNHTSIRRHLKQAGLPSTMDEIVDRNPAPLIDWNFVWKISIVHDSICREGRTGAWVEDEGLKVNDDDDDDYGKSEVSREEIICTEGTCNTAGLCRPARAFARASLSLPELSKSKSLQRSPKTIVGMVLEQRLGFCIDDTKLQRCHRKNRTIIISRLKIVLFVIDHRIDVFRDGLCASLTMTPVGITA